MLRCLIALALFIFLSAKSLCQFNCNNWLHTPSYQSYVSVGDIDVPGNQITVEAVFNRITPYSGGQAWAGDLVSKHRNPTDANYLLRPNNAEITTTNGYFTTPQICQIELNKTYHAAFVYDGVELKFYRNGFLMSSVPASGNLFQNNFQTRIGLYDEIIHNTNFIGYINEVRIWNVARTQAQLRATMNSSLPSPTTQPGLLAYYTFDNLLNKQGNPLWNGTLGGTASISQANPTCSAFIADSCGLNPCAINEDFTFEQNSCNPLNFSFHSSASLADFDLIKWNFGDGNTVSGTINPVKTYLSENNFDVEMILVKGACSDTVRKRISSTITLDNIIATPDTTLCNSAQLQLHSEPSLNFCWWPNTYLDNPNSPNPITATPQNITYYLTAQIKGNNLVVNGDFSAGNTGFISDYNYATNNITDGQYFVGSNPALWNAGFSACVDHTSGNGNMMFVNGSPNVNENVWKQTVAVTPNTNYAFSTWILPLIATNPAQLQFSINGKLMGNLINASLPTCTWTKYFTTWNSGNQTTAEISIVNKNIVAQGNDYALDDISFAPVLVKRDSVKIAVETVSVQAGSDTLICEGIQVPLTANGAQSYSWYPATGLSNANIANPIAMPVVNTQYIVTGSSANGCQAKDTVMITVNAKPVIIKSRDTLKCENASVQLSVSGGVIYSWFPQNGLSNPNIANPIASPISNTTYHVYVTDANNCTNNDSIKISIKPHPVFKIYGGTTICRNQSAGLLATGGHQYTWQPAESLNNASAPNPIATPLTSTTYSVLIRDTVCGNSATLTNTVNVRPAPEIIANKSNDIDCSLSTSQLSATGGNQYEWTPSATLSNALIANPVASPRIATKYIVKGTDHFGCSSFDSVFVHFKAINESLYLMPNAFTPNGDGNNDCFRTKFWGYVSEFDLSVFNRWGQRIFHTQKPSDCWDGTYKGTPQNQGAYIYIIRAKTLCSESVFRKGTVMLIR